MIGGHYAWGWGIRPPKPYADVVDIDDDRCCGEIGGRGWVRWRGDTVRLRAS